MEARIFPPSTSRRAIGEPERVKDTEVQKGVRGMRGLRVGLAKVISSMTE